MLKKVQQSERSDKQNNSIVDWRTLRARKAYLTLRTEDLIRATGASASTVTAFFAGNERMNLETIIKLAAALGLRPRITFESIENASEIPVATLKGAA